MVVGVDSASAARIESSRARLWLWRSCRAEDFAVTGVDISSVQIERARNFVPRAEFVCADMTEVDFPAESFAAIVSLYAIIHIPLDEQPALFAKLFEWLQPEGYLLVTVGNRAWTGVEENWLDVTGATMF